MALQPTSSFLKTLPAELKLSVFYSLADASSVVAFALVDHEFYDIYRANSGLIHYEVARTILQDDTSGGIKLAFMAIESGRVDNTDEAAVRAFCDLYVRHDIWPQSAYKFKTLNAMAEMCIKVDSLFAVLIAQKMPQTHSESERRVAVSTTEKARQRRSYFLLEVADKLILIVQPVTMAGNGRCWAELGEVTTRLGHAFSQKEALQAWYLSKIMEHNAVSIPLALGQVVHVGLTWVTEMGKFWTPATTSSYSKCWQLVCACNHNDDVPAKLPFTCDIFAAYDKTSADTCNWIEKQMEDKLGGKWGFDQDKKLQERRWLLCCADKSRVEALMEDTKDSDAGLIWDYVEEWESS